ncbi:Dabb family protein [Flavobacterium sp. ZS1P14]|uniref:Dabb family protein n=1 Tax=Flavobacterium sp. ZS1P14 TaxID=3401729 RepID=UPI003AABBD31
MKKLLLLTLILITMYGAVNAQQEKKQQVLRHVVMFGWKEGTDAAYVTKIVTALGNLQYKIPTIKAFEWGTNNSPENLNNGLTHCFVLTFSSESDRDAYLIHPDHKAFVALLNPVPDKITVFDYWASK